MVFKGNGKFSKNENFELEAYIVTYLRAVHVREFSQNGILIYLSHYEKSTFEDNMSKVQKFGGLCAL